MSIPSLSDAAAALVSCIDVTAPDPLRRRILMGYAEELQALTPEAATAWLLGRLAEIEARQAAGTLGQEEAATGVAEALVVPGTAIVECDDRMVQEGFHKTEHDSSGEPFRWTGPEPRATIFVPRLRAPAEIRVFLLHAFVPEVLEQIRLRVDGGDWAPVQVEGTESRPVLVARPEPGPAGQPAAMRLDIDTVRTDSPVNRGEPDGRVLGVAMQRVEIRSV